ncbi:cytochrome P450, partial [Pseudoneurospora amorphoporcata]
MSLSTFRTMLASSISLLLSLILFLLLLLIAIIITTSLYRLYLHPLARVPGPRLAALSNTWHAYHARNGRMYTLGKTLHKRYGPVVRVGPDELWVDGREAFKTIYSAGSGFEKSHFYLSTALSKPTLSFSFSPLPPFIHLNVNHPDTLDLLSERSLSRYRLQRRLIGPIYQLSSLSKFEPQIDAVLDHAVAELRSLKGEEVDLKEWMHILAVECLGAVVLGWSPGYIKARGDGGTSKQGYRGWKRKSVFGLFPGVTKVGFWEDYKSGSGWKLGISGKTVGRWFSNLWGVTFATPKNFKPFFTPVYQKSSRRIAAALAKADDMEEVKVPRAKPSNAKAKAKKNNMKPAKEKEVARPHAHDLLEDLINLHKSRPDQFTETYLRRMATTNFGAGHETLCSALTACMAMVGTHEAVQERVAEEVGGYLRGQHEEAGGTGSGTMVVPFDTAAKQLPYTLAAIKEAQRLHPVIAMSLSRTVPKVEGGGVVINGYRVPEGTTVGCNPVALHRNSDIFGADAHVYDPSRWLQTNTNPEPEAEPTSDSASDSDSDSNSDPDPDSDPDLPSEDHHQPQDQAEDMEDIMEKKRLREMLHLNLTYGGGARTCPGRHLAELIVWKAVPRLIAEFRVEVTHMPAEEEMERYFMSMLTGVKVRFLERAAHVGKMEDG